MNPEYPVYIVSKGRWDTRQTSIILETMGVPYHIVVEKEEYYNYSKVIEPSKILILPQSYLDNYDTFDDFGDKKSKGPGSARNFCWEHSISNGYKWHWVMDDNIKYFDRMNHNLHIRVDSGTIFKCAEDFVNRYENIAIAGLQYDFFAKSKEKHPAFILNTRIYSCLLIRNDIPYRWRGRYNEDTDLSIRVLKDGWCTLLFCAFLQEKARTQTLKGGNTKEFYEKEGTYNKSKMIEDMHPDVAKVVWRFNRWHHHVDYRPFKNNKLKLKKDLKIPDRINNYGMKLIKEPIKLK